MTIAEKMRRAVSWLDFLDENFNDHFKSADGVLKVWEKHEYEEIDNLWEYLEPDEDGWIDEASKRIKIRDKGNRQANHLPLFPITMALYRLIYQIHDRNTIGNDQRFKNDSTARTIARNLMFSNDWQYVIIERKRKGGYVPVAKYNSDLFGNYEHILGIS